MVMTVVCVSIYRSRIGVRTDNKESVTVGTLVSRAEKYDFSKSALYYCVDSENTFRFAVVVGISEAQKKIVITPLDRYDAVPYGGALYFLSSIWEREGEQMLVPLAELLTAISPDTVSESGALGLSRADDANDFLDQIKDFLLDQHQGYSIERIDVVASSDNSGAAQGKVIDITKTVEQFFIQK